MEIVGLPTGMTVELSRATVLPGSPEEADRWMAMLQERHAECVATLDRERMSVEVVFRSKEPDGTEHLWWFALPEPVRAAVEAWAVRPAEPEQGPQQYS